MSFDARRFSQYVTQHVGSPYGEALCYWASDPSDPQRLDCFDSCALDEYRSVVESYN